ncbi:MAG: hypothetical protein E7257_11200 [Lachnospiraceae bacterium]|nr:hypothetical protein [Lachnospiraceae bacterium]
MIIKNIDIKEILEAFDIPEDIFQLLLEEYKKARVRIGISEETYSKMVECILDSLVEQLYT